MVPIETDIAALNAEHKVSVSALAVLDGSLSAASLSKALSGQAALSTEKEQSLRETIGAIRSVIVEYPHLSLDFNRGTSKMKPLIDQRRKELREQTDPMCPRCCVVRISRTGFFLRIRNGEVITSPSELLCAAFESPALADEVVRELAKRNVRAHIETFGAVRRRTTLANSLYELGFESAAIGGTDGQATTEN